MRKLTVRTHAPREGQKWIPANERKARRRMNAWPDPASTSRGTPNLKKVAVGSSSWQ
jgi:hypothetical protein